MHSEGRDLSKHSLVSALVQGGHPPMHGPSGLIQLRRIAFCSSCFFHPELLSSPQYKACKVGIIIPIKRKLRCSGINVN